MEPVLKVEGLRKSYGSFEAVKGIDLTVAPNEILALIGPNGAGKSTTLKLVATILTATSGRIEVAGHDLSRDAAAVWPAEVISAILATILPGTRPPQHPARGSSGRYQSCSVGIPRHGAPSVGSRPLGTRRG